MARGGKGKAIARRGLMLVLSSPSGAGKTTLSRKLLDAEAQHRAVDLGDDARRGGAARSNGRHYHFIDRKQFDQMVKTGELLEYAEVFGNFYGTPREPVEKALKQGRDVLFDIDWQGTQQLRERAPRRSGQRVSCCRRRAANWRGGCTPARRTTEGDPRPHGEGRRRDEPLGRIRLCRGQPRSRPRVRRRARDPCTPSGSSASDRPACPRSCAGCNRSC